MKLESYIQRIYLATYRYRQFALPLLLSCLFTVFSPLASAAQHDTQGFTSTADETYLITAHRLLTGEIISIDGRLDEDVWNRIPGISSFRQQEPVEGATPSQETYIQIAYDSDNLYIAARMFDSDVSGIRGWERRRDQGLGADDRFMWILDTFNDGRTAYFFEVNPLGLMGDGLLTTGQGSSVNKAWNGIWDARVEITSEGWMVEVRIPFRTLDFNPDNPVWGVNFQRTVRRNNEEIVWAGWRRNQGLFRPQNAGTLIGLEGLSQGLGLEIKPYLMANPSRRWQDGSTSNTLRRDAGFDITYSITPGIRSSLSVNTDFAEAEVDERRVNLTRFPLQFPEQRDFFLEGSSIFSFAPGSGPNPFFSRRIGLVGGNPVPIVLGARVIGRTGNTGIGFYQIRTGESTLPSEDFTVARLTQNFGAESKIGVIYTRRDQFGDKNAFARETFGTDLELETSRFMGNKNLQFQLFFVGHTADSPLDESSFYDRTVRGMRISFPNFPFYGHASYREFGDAYNPAVGFAPRNGFRRFQPTVGYTHMTRNSTLVRSLNTQLYYEYLMDMDFRAETIRVNARPVTVRLESGGQFGFSLDWIYDRLDAPFDIRRDGSIIIPTDEYRNVGGEFWMSTNRAAPISADFGLSHESFWTGTRTQLQAGSTVRPAPGINLSSAWARTQVDLAEGSFTTDLLRFRGNLDFTPFVSVTGIVQYDTLSELVGFYQRLRWIVRPGADVYLVYIYNWINEDDRLRPLETSGSVKVSYTYRF
ncbi:MAG: carbohydrate binding family 9 domain-containing protein [Balneolales bacterium]|nr:carbohydrate binding family 9 domain-containing protein [Balneolales bacterium]